VISQVYFRIGRDGLSKFHTFEEVLDAIIAEGRYRNIDLYSIDGRIVADLLLRYEDATGWPAVLTTRLHLPPLRSLPRAKGGFRRDATAAKDILSAQQKQLIQEVCREEFSHFRWDR